MASTGGKQDRSDDSQDRSDCHISRLPAEVMELVADTADPQDLLALRRACKDIHGKIQKVFVRTHFTVKSFLLPVPESMQALVDISQHEVFGRALKQLNLVTRRVGDAKFDARQRQNAVPGVVASPEQRAKDREQRRRHQSLETQQTQYWRQEIFHHALMQAFTSLSGRQHGVHVGLFHSYDQSPRPWGEKWLARALGYPDCLDLVHSRADLGADVLGIVAQSGCQVQGLTFAEPYTLPDTDMTTTPAIGNTAGSFMAHLQVLDVTVYLFGTATVPVKWAALVKALQTLPSLQRMRIHNKYQRLNPDFFRHIAASATLPSIREASFTGLYASTEDVITFLVNHRASLEAVEIEGLQDVDRAWVSAEEARESIRRGIARVGMEFDLSQMKGRNLG